MRAASGSMPTRLGQRIAWLCLAATMGACAGAPPTVSAETSAEQVQGGACMSGAECGTGFCVDGVCCDVADCSGACQACDTASAPGVCATVVNAIDADTCTGASYCDGGGACVPKQSSGSSCMLSVQCSSDRCVDGYCCETSCSGPCLSCAAIPGSCTSVTGAEDADTCADIHTCDEAGACKLKNGQGCATDGTLCASSFCVDGYCCNQACGGGCDVCASSLGASANGTCTIEAAGGAGQDPGCAPYLCGGAASCPSTCAADGDCVDASYCAADGTCQPRKAQGLACDSVADCELAGCRVCASGNCVDGYCCDSACAGGCDTCAATPGTCSPRAPGTSGTSPACGAYLCDGATGSCPTSCTLPTECAAGAVCSGGACVAGIANGQGCSMGTECLSGHCVDGVCCNTACAGNCYACNLGGSVGQCTQAQAGSDPRNLCPAGPDASCDARCDASGLCAYPGLSRSCQAASCVAGTATLQNGRSCNGAGACVDRGTTSCGPYSCSGAACPTSCVDSSACVAPATCMSTSCGMQRKLGDACTTDRDCGSGHCADGVCCDTACQGTCKACNLAGAMGTCTTATGLDPHGDCAGEGVCAGQCADNASCRFPDASKACDTCKACNGAGKCNQAPLSGDDPACSVVSCAGLSTECAQFSDLGVLRCVSVGLCAAPNDATSCTQVRNMPDGARCSGGACKSGQCVASSPDAGEGAERAGGCSHAARAAEGATSGWLVLVLIALGRARRRIRAGDQRVGSGTAGGLFGSVP